MEVRRLFMGSMDGFLGPAMPFNGYAILHPQGVVLVDTAFGEVFGKGRSGEVVFGDQRWPWTARSTLAGLEDHGIELGDVRYVINTHLGDHSGENHLFKDASFLIREDEAEWARKHMPPEFNEPWDFAGAKFEPLGREDVEVLPGITCVFTPGHTAGHQSILVDTGSAKELLVGDAVYTTDVWDDLDSMKEGHPAWESQQMAGYEQWRESAEKLRALRADVVHFAHDPAVLRGS